MKPKNRLPKPSSAKNDFIEAMREIDKVIFESWGLNLTKKGEHSTMSGMEKINGLLEEVESHEEWLDIMRFGLEGQVKQGNILWIIEKLQEEAIREVISGVKSDEMFLIPKYMEELNIKLHIST